MSPIGEMGEKNNGIALCPPLCPPPHRFSLTSCKSFHSTVPSIELVHILYVPLTHLAPHQCVLLYDDCTQKIQRVWCCGREVEGVDGYLRFLANEANIPLATFSLPYKYRP